MSDATSGAPAGVAARGSTADLIYDAVIASAAGASVLALYFLALDLLAGRGLFTPSLVGTVLFTGATPSAETAIRLDMVAYFSIVHLLAFGALGVSVALLAQRTGLMGRPAAVLAGVLFVALSAGSLGAAGLVMPGVVGVIGLPRIVAGNLLTAVAMTFVLRRAHRDDAPGG